MSVMSVYARELMPVAEPEPAFRPGDRIRISWRSAAGLYRMPFYLRGKRGTVEAVLENSAGGDRTYRLAIPLTEIWPDYIGSPRDGLRIEVGEPWLVPA